VSRFLIPNGRRIADATMEEMPQINWGAAVLAATYRGLCAGCTKTAPSRSSPDVRFCCTYGATSDFLLVGHRSNDQLTGRWRTGTTQ
jgi:hypothetical protein